MEMRTAVTQTRSSIQSAIKNLPRDIDGRLFLQLVNTCMPGRKGLSESEFQNFLKLARNFQSLPASQQSAPLLATRSQRGPAKSSPSHKISRDPVEQEILVKGHVSVAAAWMRDLKRLGVASASSYIFAGRRSTAPKPPRDWANDVLHHHYCQELAVQESVTKHLSELQNVFVQLPDRRWHIKYQGEAIPPLADKGGLGCIYSLIHKNHLDYLVVKDDERSPYCAFMPTSTGLNKKRQDTNHAHLLESHDLDSECTTKSFDAVRGDQANDGGKRRIVNARTNPEDKQILRAIAEIAAHSSRIAYVLNSAITSDSLGVLSFKDPNGADWATEIPQLPGDASIDKIPSGWLVHIPWCDEPIYVPPDREKGMLYIARLLQQTGATVPVGLMSNWNLLNSLLDRPPYQKLFKRTFQRLVKLNDNVIFDAGTRKIIDAVHTARGYRSKYYEITHAITRGSPLAKYITTGLVSLTPDGLGGVLHLLRKAHASCVLGGEQSPELRVLAGC